MPVALDPPWVLLLELVDVLDLFVLLLVAAAAVPAKPASINIQKATCRMIRAGFISVLLFLVRR
jgi:hypothetical protein